MPITEAAEYLQVSVQYMRRLVASGRVKGKMISGVWLVNKTSLIAFAKKTKGYSNV